MEVLGGCEVSVARFRDEGVLLRVRAGRIPQGLVLVLFLLVGWLTVC